MIRSEKEEYWRDRADRYSSFKWANDEGYLSAFIDACDLKKHHIVLDAGCGTGIVTRAVSPLVKRVIGLDNSRDMLSQCDGDLNFMFGDIDEIPFPSGVFDRVLARNVFHHMTENLLQGISECCRVLKPGGKIIVGERTPPSNDRRVHAEYRDMLLLKENRHTFTEDNLHYFLASDGFKNITSFPFWIRGFDVREWLENSDLDTKTQAKIWECHVNGSDEFKEASHMVITDEPIYEKKGIVHCHIDLKNIIMIGEKP